MEKKFLEQFTELLELEAEATLEDHFRDYEVWDSLAYLSLISFVDEEYDIVIPSETFKSMNTVRDICEYIKANVQDQ